MREPQRGTWFSSLRLSRKTSGDYRPSRMPHLKSAQANGLGFWGPTVRVRQHCFISSAARCGQREDGFCFLDATSPGSRRTSAPAWVWARTYQITNLFPTLTVLDNLRLSLISFKGIRFRMHRAGHRLDGVNQEARVWFGANLDFGTHARSRSGTSRIGHQRQLEVVMALALEPKILLLDEPTAGLSAAEVGPIVEDDPFPAPGDDRPHH